MSYGVYALVILVTSLASFGGFAWLTHEPRVPLAPLADPEPLPGERVPFPDTGPLLLLSEAAAAVEAHEREVRAMGDEAERKIPARWR